MSTRYNKPFKCFYLFWIILNRQKWFNCQIRKCFCCFIKCLPSIPGCFLPLLRNADVVSEPVNAWKKRRALALDSPSWLYIVLILMYCMYFPAPYSTHTSSTWAAILKKSPTRMTMTSESTVLCKFLHVIFNHVLEVEHHSCISFFMVALWHGDILIRSDFNTIGYDHWFFLRKGVTADCTCEERK